MLRDLLATGGEMDFTRPEGQWLRHLLRNGALDYLACRFTDARRKLNSWGAFRHQMADPLLIEGAIHHLDILIELAGSTCETVFARTWNPPWGEYAGDSEGVVLMDFEFLAETETTL